MKSYKLPKPVKEAVGLHSVVRALSKFTNTETSRPVALPPIDEADKSPKGLGRDGNKPLMRNRTANEVPSPIGNAGGNTFPMKPFYNPNPRIGVMLEHGGASMRTKTVLWRFRLRGLVWLRKNWPEERMRCELRGYGPKTSKEWNALLAKRPNSEVRHGGPDV